MAVRVCGTPCPQDVRKCSVLPLGGKKWSSSLGVAGHEDGPARLTLEEMWEGVWDPKICVPKMAQPDFPNL